MNTPLGYSNYSHRSNGRPPVRSPLQPLPPRRQTHGHWRRTLLATSFAIVLCVGIYLATSVHVHHAHAKELAQQSAAEKVAQVQRVMKLPASIQAILAAHAGVQFGISVVDPSGQEKLYGSTAAVEAASTAKVLTAIAYFHAVELGNATLDGYIGSYTARSRLQAMIVDSDDPSWDALNGYLGDSQLADYATSIGINDYNIDNNILSPHDLSILLVGLNNGKLLNTTDRDLLLGWLKVANYREYIVPAVPAGDTVYHKIGLVDDNVNDAAIISDGKRAVILSIFTDGNGSYDWNDRAIAMQQITKAVVSAYL